MYSFNIFCNDEILLLFSFLKTFYQLKISLYLKIFDLWQLYKRTKRLLIIPSALPPALTSQLIHSNISKITWVSWQLLYDLCRTFNIFSFLLTLFSIQWLILITSGPTCPVRSRDDSTWFYLTTFGVYTSFLGKPSNAFKNIFFVVK